MRLTIFAIVLLCAGAPLAAQETTSVYEAAVEARRSGDNVTAIRLIEPWLDAHPDDLDARVQLGYAYLAQGRRKAAREQFAFTLSRAPGYEDARNGLAMADRRDSDASPRHYLLVDGAYASVGQNAQDWQESGGALGLPVRDSTSLELRGTWFRRFGTTDAEAGAQISSKVGDGIWIRLGGSVSPSATFRPRMSLTGGVDARALGGADATLLGLDVAYQSYAVQDVVRVSPHTVQYFGAGRWSLTARIDAVVTDGRVLFGGSLRGDWYGAAGARAFLGAGRGPDAELGTVTRTTSVYGGGQWPFANGLALLGNVAREWREGPGDRTEFRLGLKLSW